MNKKDVKKITNEAGNLVESLDQLVGAAKRVVDADEKLQKMAEILGSDSEQKNNEKRFSHIESELKKVVSKIDKLSDWAEGFDVITAENTKLVNLALTRSNENREILDNFIVHGAKHQRGMCDQVDAERMLQNIKANRKSIDRLIEIDKVQQEGCLKELT